MAISIREMFPDLFSGDEKQDELRRLLLRVEDMSQLDEKKLADLTREREFDLKSREVAVKEQELVLKQKELSQKRQESARHVQSPLLIAIWVAVLGLCGNFIVSYVNAKSQISLEKQKDESALILDALKPDNIEDRCSNLLILEGTNLVAENRSIEELCIGTKVWNALTSKPAQAESPRSTPSGDEKSLPTSKH